MIEVQLEGFEEFYKERLDFQFSKIKKIANKMLSEIRENLIEIKVCMDHFLETGEEKIESKALKSLHFFSDRMRKEIDEVEIPEEEVTYDSIMDLLNSIKKLFNSINEIAKKSLPKFQKQVQREIKELNYITKKLGKRQGILDDFLRNKYKDLKDAEYILKKLPKLFTLKDNIENAKKDLGVFELDLEEKQKIQEEFNSQLLKLEKHELFSRLEEKKDDLFKLRIKLTDQLGFKKALKKLKFELEKDTLQISNINLYYLRDFLKKPLTTLSNESKDLPKFSSLLIQLRHVLEENKLNLKTDTKDKTIEQINIIFDKKTIFGDIEEYKATREEIKKIEEEINVAGLAAELDNLKNEISSNTLKLEHLQHDLERKNKDYLRYLGNLKNDREEFQKSVQAVIGEEMKLGITFSF